MYILTVIFNLTIKHTECELCAKFYLKYTQSHHRVLIFYSILQPWGTICIVPSLWP